MTHSGGGGGGGDDGGACERSGSERAGVDAHSAATVECRCVRTSGHHPTESKRMIDYFNSTLVLGPYSCCFGAAMFWCFVRPANNSLSYLTLPHLTLRHLTWHNSPYFPLSCLTFSSLPFPSLPFPSLPFQFGKSHFLGLWSPELEKPLVPVVSSRWH